MSDIYTITAEEQAEYFARKQKAAENIERLANSVAAPASIDAWRKFQFASRLFDNELRRHDLDETPRRVGVFLAGFSLHCGRLVAPIAKQKDISDLTGISESHVSEALSWLANRDIFIYRKEDFRRGDRVLRRALWEPVLDSKRWSVKALFPLTRAVIEKIAALYSPDQQFDLDFGEDPSLHDILQQLSLERILPTNLPGSDSTRWSAPGAKRGGSTDIIDAPAHSVTVSPHREVNRGGPPDDRSGGSSSRVNDAEASPRVNGELSPKSSQNPQQSSEDAWKRAAEKLRSWRKSVFGGEVPSGGTSSVPDGASAEESPNEPEKSSATGNFSEKEFRHTELSRNQVPSEKSSVDGAKSDSEAAPGAVGPEFPSRARETVKLFKQCTDNSFIKQCAGHDLEKQNGGGTAVQGDKSRWRNNPSPRERELLRRIAEAVGDEDAVTWQLLWLNGWIRTYPHVVIEWAVEETLLRLKEHGPGYFTTSASAYLKGAIKRGYKIFLAHNPQ